MQELSIREKREFYYGLARLIRSGSAISRALETLSHQAPPRYRRFLASLHGRVQGGTPLGDALLAQHPAVTALEGTIMQAAERSGRLDRACDQLGKYFDALDRARTEMRKRLMYPLVALHLGVFVFKIQLIMTKGVDAFLEAGLVNLLYLYTAAGAVWVLWSILTAIARTSPDMDRLLSMLPGVGPVRWKFALARFFTTLDAQLEAGVNVWDAFANAARTSDSARIIAGARKALPMLQAGGTLADSLAQNRVLPDAYVRALRVAEQTGELDRELPRQAEDAEGQALAALSRWSEWLPRMIYAGVLMYVGYEVVSFYQGYLQTLNNIGNLGQ